MEQHSHSLFTVSEVELVYRNKVKPEDRLKITSPENAYDAFISAWDLNKIDMVEQFYVLFVDRAMNCLGISNVFTGGISSVQVDPKIIFAMALKANASGIFVAHNHPSNHLDASKPDIDITKKLVAGGKVLDIHVYDHQIVTSRKYFSFAEQGLI